jgi:hypothetical protein
MRKRGYRLQVAGCKLLCRSQHFLNRQSMEKEKIMRNAGIQEHLLAIIS